MPSDYERIATAIHFLEQQQQRQPGLAELAAAVHLSPFHLQRLFQRWAGVSPKRFLQFLTVEHAKHLLAQSHDLLNTSLAVGLSGPARLHEQFVTLEAVTPGEYKRGGDGLDIGYGVHDSPFGRLWLAATARGVCALAFLETAADAGGELATLRQRWPKARLLAAPETTGILAGRLFPPQPSGAAPLSVLVRGSNFQIQVWRALLAIPAGQRGTYQQIASAIGRPTATRAVGQAVGANPIAYLIPCHRVIRSTGLIGGYRWGSTRKQALLVWESAQQEMARPCPTTPGCHKVNRPPPNDLQLNNSASIRRNCTGLNF